MTPLGGAARLAQLLGETWLTPLTVERAQWLRTLPGFDAIDERAWPGTGDDWAARHHAVLEREVQPYASVFLEADGHLGGGVTAAAADAMRAFGVEMGGDAPAADHAGLAFLFLGDLMRWQAQALAAGDPIAADRFLQGQRLFLGEQLLYWWPEADLAVQGAGDAFYAGLARLSTEFLGEQVAVLRPEPGPPPPSADVPDLDAPKTGIHQVATYLSTPARSGVFWGPRTLRAWGQRFEAPSGFGSRRDLLETLLRTTAELDLGWGALLAQLSEAVEEAAAALDGLADSTPFAPWIHPRRDRLGATAEIIRGLGQPSADLK